MAAETVKQFYLKNVLSLLVADDDGVTRLAPSPLDNSISWSDGSGDNQILQVWMDLDRSLGATTETLDLDNLTVMNGTTSTVTKVKYLYIKNKSTGVLKIGGGDWTPLFADPTDKLLIPAGASVQLVLPQSSGAYAVTASTGDGLLIELTVAGTYDIVIGFI